jgi:hypothetical protein
MSFTTKVFFACLIVIGFDALASFVSRMLELEYVYFILVSLLIYFAVGFWGAFRQGFAYGILLAAIAGLADSTVGWFVSRMIGPYIQPKVPQPNFMLVAVTVITVTTLALALGSVGAVLCKLTGQTRTADV